MEISVNVEMTNNIKAVQDALDSQLEQALIAIGMTAESYAKLPVASGGYMPVDTGRLKNSITYAIAGQPPNIQSYQGDKGEAGGSYSGSAPQDPNNRPRSVYIGTNVEYAAEVENGVSGKITGRHYLRHAIVDHVSEYKSLMEQALKGS